MDIDVEIDQEMANAEKDRQAQRDVVKAFKSAVPYVPRDKDTSANHDEFRCDKCDRAYEWRDLLQKHKATAHNLVEIGFDLGNTQKPTELMGAETGSRHRRIALQVFEGGSVSPSPCHACTAKAQPCIVSSNVSAKCVECCLKGNGEYCGAAGVKHK